MDEKKILISDYPQLSFLCWFHRTDIMITEKDALYIYESRWRYMDLSLLDEKEKKFLQHLIDTVGKGVLNV